MPSAIMVTRARTCRVYVGTVPVRESLGAGPFQDSRPRVCPRESVTVAYRLPATINMVFFFGNKAAIHADVMWLVQTPPTSPTSSFNTGGELRNEVPGQNAMQ